MKIRVLLCCVLLCFLAEAAVLFLFVNRETDIPQDAVAVNEIVKTVEADWYRLDSHRNHTALDYAVLDESGRVLFQTAEHISSSIHAAIRHRDTILAAGPDGKKAGSIVIYNTAQDAFAAQKQAAGRLAAILILVQAAVIAVHAVYLEQRFVKPFQRLKHFAQRVAGGCLDLPLEMDRGNIFGAFTESFDIMRTELKQARMAEAEADAEKKELVAKLSHDIKTPVASIQAASELGLALSEGERMKENYTQIIRKAEQINTLVTGLFTAALEELRQLPVVPAETGSRVLGELLENADYLHRARMPEIPGCVLYADPFRLQQVLDNIFSNSYKYAGTDIRVQAYAENRYLILEIEDSGGGVQQDEIPLLKEKFRRGSNAQHMEGAGLGLYISDYFMREMDGTLDVQNGKDGLRVRIGIARCSRQPS